MGAGRGRRRQRLGGLGNLIRGPWMESEKNNISLYDICNHKFQISLLLTTFLCNTCTLMHEKNSECAAELFTSLNSASLLSMGSTCWEIHLYTFLLRVTMDTTWNTMDTGKYGADTGTTFRGNIHTYISYINLLAVIHKCMQYQATHMPIRIFLG